MRKLVPLLAPSYRNGFGQALGEHNGESEEFCKASDGSRLHFAAIRDPWTRFVSGFREIVADGSTSGWFPWRAEQGRPSLGKDAKKIDTGILLNAFIEDVADGYMNPHTVTQSYYFFNKCSSLPDFIGEIEDGFFVWRAYLRLVGLGDLTKEKKYNFPHAYRKSGVDYAPLMTDASWRRFCTHYRQDYACFAYTPHPECKPGGRGFSGDP